MKFRKDIPEGEGNLFIKLKDGEHVFGVFRGEPYEFFTIWDKSAGKSHVVEEGTKGASFRFRLNFVVKENGEYVAKIFENGATVYKQLDEINQEYNLEGVVVKLKRNGTGLDTTYSILPSANQKADQGALTKVKLLDLKHQDKDSEPPMPSQENAPSFDQDEELPF